MTRNPVRDCIALTKADSGSGNNITSSGNMTNSSTLVLRVCCSIPDASCESGHDPPRTRDLTRMAAEDEFFLVGT